MATVKKNKKSETGTADSLWRQPITLDSFEDDDPLQTLYRGREVGDSERDNEGTIRAKAKKSAIPSDETAKNSSKPAQATAKPNKRAVEKTPAETKAVSDDGGSTGKNARSTKINAEELKNILKIKSDSFQFTDIREILRGKSYDIYVYLRFLSKEAGVCKLKHLDMMSELDISRPTLFKQSDWLTRLSLIEKRNVPGDHLGTSYTVHRLEDVLPISETILKQIQAEIENFGRKAG